MCVDCVLATPRIVEVDPGDGSLPEVVLSQKDGAKTIQVAMSVC
jgi:hypothetical protein